MGVKLEEMSTAIVDNPKSRQRKPSYQNTDLPFPSINLTQYGNRWKKGYKATIIEWAGSTSDPFRTNSIMDSVVKQSWRVVFPNLAKTYEDKDKQAIIIGMVS